MKDGLYPLRVLAPAVVACGAVAMLSWVLSVRAPLSVDARPELPIRTSAPAQRAPGSSTSALRAVPPLLFVENRGQWDTPAAFVAWRGGTIARAERDRIMLQYEPIASEEVEERSPGMAIALAFEGSRLGAEPRSERPSPGHYSFFLGSDAQRWRTRVPAWRSVRYDEVWDGISIRLREGAHAGIEYDVLVEPDADLRQVIVRCDGIEGLELLPTGELVLRTALGKLTQTVPVATTVADDGNETPVACRFRVIDERRYGFELDGPPPDRAVLIDPGLVWSTAFGYPGFDEVSGSLLLDAWGNLTFAGFGGAGSGFPATPGAYDTSANGMGDVWVCKMDPSGSELIYCTLLGGAGIDSTSDVAVDGTGSVTVVGDTGSGDFPTTPGAFRQTPPSAPFAPDGFVARLSPMGDALMYSTYLGGAMDGEGDIVVAPTDAGLGVGAVTVAGSTASTDFPTTPGAFQSILSLCDSMFITRFDPSGGLVFSTLLGSNGCTERAEDLVVDELGITTVVGYTGGSDFPTTPGAFQPVKPGNTEAFVTSLNATGSALVFSTFIGGSAQDWGKDIERLPSGSFLVAGDTKSTNFPTTPGAFDTTVSIQAGFLLELAPDGSDLTWCTALDFASIQEMALDPDGSIGLTGVAFSGLPLTPDAYDSAIGCISTVFLSRFDVTGSELLYSTYFGSGGTFCPKAYGVVSQNGFVTILGEMETPFWPTTPGAFDESWNGAIDTFLAQFDTNPAWVDLGQGLAGTLGVPRLNGMGLPSAGYPNTLELTRAKPNATVTMVIGLSALNAPLKGGVLVPAPALLIFGLTTNGGGVLTLNVDWPAAIPAGTQLYVQDWIVDAAGPAGLSASNGLLCVTR